MPRRPNAAGSGPKVTKQSKNKGPIFGKPTSLSGTTRPVDWSKGTNKSLKPKHAVQGRK